MPMTFSRTPRALLLATVLALPLAPALAEDAAPKAEVALPAITVTSVAARKLEDHVLASGLISAIEQVSVVPLIEGQPIETLEADVGDTVTKGQVLATLSSATLTLQQSQLQASLAAAQAAAAEAEKTATRSAALLAQGSTSTAANDQAQMALTTARAQATSVQAQLDNVNLMLKRTRIVAPVAGVISARNAQMGAVASAAGQPLFVIIKDGALELRADVAEADMPRIQPGQAAQITLAANLPPLSGKIRLIEPDVDATTRLGRARIALDASPQVRAGMYAEADILVTAHDALAVPVTAVGSEGDQTTVMQVKDGVIHRATVTTGIRQDGWVEILSGLSAGDLVVAKAGAFVSDGDKINPVQATN